MCVCCLHTDSVKKEDGCTLVHCMAGISRSATVCIAYLIKHMDWDLQKAFGFLKAKRSCVAPNLSFMGQLMKFQQQLHTSLDIHQENESDKITQSKNEQNVVSPKLSFKSSGNKSDSWLKTVKGRFKYVRRAGSTRFSYEAKRKGLKLKIPSK